MMYGANAPPTEFSSLIKAASALGDAPKLKKTLEEKDCRPIHGIVTHMGESQLNHNFRSTPTLWGRATGWPWFVRLLVGLAILAAAIGLLGFFGQWALDKGWFEGVDRFVIDVEPDHPLRAFFVGVTWLGTVAGVITVSVVMVSILLWRRLFRGTAALLASLLTSAVANNSLKEWVARERPAYANHFDATGFSYPSGHAFVCTAVFGFFAYLLLRTVKGTARRWVLGIVTAIAVGLIGFSRIYLGVHYTSDVIGGYILGVIWMTVWAIVFWPLDPKVIRH